MNKIEVSDRGGRILFGAKPNIDPLAIIRLVQSPDRIYRLEGQEKLRFDIPLETFEARSRFVERLVRTLLPAPESAPETLHAKG